MLASQWNQEVSIIIWIINQHDHAFMHKHKESYGPIAKRCCLNSNDIFYRQLELLWQLSLHHKPQKDLH